MLTSAMRGEMLTPNPQSAISMLTSGTSGGVAHNYTIYTGGVGQLLNSKSVILR